MMRPFLATLLPYATVLAFACTLAGMPDHAEACYLPLPKHIKVDSEKKEDKGPPSAIGKLEVRVVRGMIERRCSRRDEEPLDCAPSSLDDLGAIHLDITPPKDDRTVPQRIGYRLSVARGTMPKGFELPGYDVGDSSFSLRWTDGTRRRDIEPFRFLLDIRPVDQAGHVGPAKLVWIAHRGRRARRNGTAATR